ncbi:MAG TPA: VIT1/CCC1 transporter family protein [Ilumatobacteraceae bacterium]|nr:VIT1/CCC1 transporter family protein [Ilumatobacteraceae bacterium]
MSRSELHGGHRSVSGGLARAAVFGVNDGLVSNVSLILGFAASGVDSSVVRLAGLAGAIAGGISMAAGEWISVSAQNELVERELAVERRELAGNAEAETDELAAMYEEHGISPETARAAAEDVMLHPEVALRVHAREEMGVDPSELPSALAAAAISLVCFLFGALLPVIPWFTGASGFAPAAVSVGIGVVAAGFVGAAIGQFAERSIVKSIVRQITIVLVACAITYAIGDIVGVNVG